MSSSASPPCHQSSGTVEVLSFWVRINADLLQTFLLLLADKLHQVVSTGEELIMLVPCLLWMLCVLNLDLLFCFPSLVKENCP